MNYTCLDGSHGHYGYYAQVAEDGTLLIGEARGREGGTLYEGLFLRDNTPYIKEIEKENPLLYFSIMKHYNVIKK